MQESGDCSSFTLGTKAVYRVEVGGEVDSRSSSYFGDALIQHIVSAKGDTNTLLTAKIIDQSALIGLLSNLNSLGFPVLSVKCISAGNEADAKMD